MSEVKCLCVGDVCGKFKFLLDKINLINKKNGPFEIMFCVGEFFGPDDEENQKLINGDYEFPFDTYILGPCCPQTAEYYQLKDGDEFCPNLTYLGKRGILFSAWGLTIAYLSGIESKTSNVFQFNDADIQEVMLPIRSKPDFTGIDILLTAEWPAEVHNHSINQPSVITPGSKLISRMAAALKPRYHFAGRSCHFERTPYRNHRVLMEAAQHVTRFIGLASVENTNKEKWVYAFNLKPMKSIQRAELTKQPDVTSEFPYMNVLQEYVASQAQEQSQGGSQYFFDTNHYSDDEEESEGRDRKRHGFKDGPPMKKSHQSITADKCWFCLSNVDAERHLVVSVGTHSYMSLPKGGLNDLHVMILSIGHVRSMLEASEEVRQEINQFKDAFVLMCDKLDKLVCVFERNYKTSHLQLQLVPVPKQTAKVMRSVLLSEADQCGLELCFLKPEDNMADVVNSGVPYFYIELPDGSRLFAHGASISNLNLNFAREVLANKLILNCEKKADWKSCVLTKQRETEIAEQIKKSFKPFDFTADSDSD